MSDVLTRAEGHVGVVELNRPPHNFFDRDLIAAVGDALDGFVAAGLRAAVLCAVGKNFCAGADFSTRDERLRTAGPEHLYRMAERIFRCPIPIVAAVQGQAVGGGLGLALAADFRVASARSRFTANFNRLGFHPGFGLTVTLPRVVGAQRAALLFYTGRRISGTEAHEIGLVDVLCPEGGEREGAMALATEIALSAPIAVQATRATLRAGLADAVVAATDHELEQQQLHYQTEDFREGIKASAERRLPEFRGR